MQTVTFRGPVRKGLRILKSVAPKTWYNPDGGPFEVTRPLTPWIQALIRSGDVEVVEPAKQKPKPKPKTEG